MTDDNTTQAVEPENDAQAASNDTTDDVSAELAKVRAEAAKWRTQLRQEQAKTKELTPLAEQYQQLQESQKTEAQKMAETIESLKAQMAQAEASAQAAQASAKLTSLAAKAGVDPELASMLDLSKIDLSDEDAALVTLQKLAPAQSAAGSVINPGRNSDGSESEDAIRAWYNNRGKNNSPFVRS